MVSKRAKQHAIHGAEDGRVSTDPKGQSDGCDGKEAFLFQELTECVLKILRKIFQPAGTTLVAALFGHTGSVSKGGQGCTARFFPRKAVADAMLDLQV